jgi:lipoprotein-anchoring transpeptidase ErfK/SrfK
MRTTWGAAALALAVSAAAVVGCSGDKPSGQGGAQSVGGKPNAVQPTPPAVPFTFSIWPTGAAAKKALPVSTEVGTKVEGGEITNVTLTPKSGKAVKGALRDDKTSWVPDDPLAYDTGYTASVTARSTDGTKTETKTTSFTTLGHSGNDIGSGLYLFDGKTYGVAMPVVVEFVPGIPAKDRAAVQRRMFVKTDPPQPGAWHWVSSGTQAFYRAPTYWQPGTTITVRIGLEGIPLSNGRYGNEDRRATAKIGDKVEMKVDNATKKMTVFENDKAIRTFPVSLGKSSTPSSSGTMVVMDKQESTVFDTFAELGPSEGYRVTIEYAQRLTWSGEYIHSAPWSVDDQGVRNVSHGCVNVAPGNAIWLFGTTKVGDPVTVKGTERELTDGNGWTAWNMSWSEYIKGSALPVPADLAKAGTAPAPSPTQVAAAAPTPTPTA